MKSYNQMSMKGKLHSYALEDRDTDNGPAISGTVTLQVDEAGATVEARFYATPTYSSGKVNRTYNMLEDIMSGNYKTVVDDGVDEADFLAMTGNIDVSYFKPRDGKVESVDDLARSQKMRGSFLNANRRKEYENKWNCDLYIKRVDDIEADEERGLDRYVRIYGYIVDDYRKQVNEVQFDARTAAAMNYLLSLPLDGEYPYAVSTWGAISAIERKSIKKNAFGSDEVQTYETKSWTISGMNPEPYEFGADNVMTIPEWTECYDNLQKAKAAELEREDTNGGSSKPKLAF